MSRDYQDTVVILDVPGGGSHVTIFFQKLKRAFGEAANAPDFVDFKLGHSVGGIFQSALAVPDDTNPNISGFTINSTGQLIREHIPYFLPDKPLHLAEQLIKAPLIAARAPVATLENIWMHVIGRGAQKIEGAIIEGKENARDLYEAWLRAKRKTGDADSKALSSIPHLAAEYNNFQQIDPKTGKAKKEKRKRPLTLNYDRHLNEFVLKFYMGETTFAQSKGSTIIGAYKIGPDKQEALDLTHIDPQIFERFRANDNATADAQKSLLRLSSQFDDMKLYEAALGTSAVPAHFSSYHAKSINAHLVDNAIVGNSQHSLLRIRKAIPNAHIVYIKVGKAMNTVPINPLDWDKDTWLGLARKGHIGGAAEATQIQNQYKSACELFGEENVFFLYEGLQAPVKIPTLDVSFTDGRKRQLEKMETFADEVMALNPEIYDRTTEVIEKILHARKAPRGDSAFGVRTPAEPVMT